ncbi:MAG: hypothetical protein R3B06_05780 [Kofleriaceae bacterium]
MTAGPAARALRIAFVLPYGERSDGFFPATFLGQLCAEARAAGHHGALVRVYYAGDGGPRDRAIGDRLRGWLDAGGFELVVLERLFDPAPIAGFVAAAPGRRGVLVVRGDSVEPAPGIALVVGGVRGSASTGRTRSAVTVWQVAQAFAALVQALAAGADPAGVPGVAAIIDGALVGAPLPPEAGPRRGLAPALDHATIADGPAPPIVRHTLFGNAGCPYAADPRALPMYRALAIPADAEVARLGCAFCSMGGDYERRPDADVIAALVAQARHVMTHAPATRELVLDDQHALRYLAALIEAAAAAGVPAVRWLFAARADAFVRERARVEAAIASAAAAGASIEVYLTGFEAFCDAELQRYNKGTTVDDQLDAVAAMRALAAAHPGAFDYAAARGHSLILWNPWTTPADLAATLATVRAHGLDELFAELGRNRLRLYPDLPIYFAAAAAGALTEAWADGERGAGARKGYHRERPWRFLDRRTALAWQLAEALRGRLGTATEASQLAAVAALAEGFVGEAAAIAPTAAAVVACLDRLAARLTGLATRADGPPRGRHRDAEVVRVTGPCNNGCAACPNGARYQPEPARARVDAARATGRPVVLAGREPTVRADVAALVAAARGDDARPVGLVTNGRRCAYAAFTRALVDAGLTAASVKLFAPTAAAADAIARDAGAHDQAVAGVRALVRAGVAVEVRAPVDAGNLDQLGGYADLTAALGASQLRLEVALDAVGLGNLGAAVAAIDALVERCAALDVALEVSPLDAGATLHRWMPVLPSRTR